MPPNTLDDLPPRLSTTRAALVNTPQLSHPHFAVRQRSGTALLAKAPLIVRAGR